MWWIAVAFGSELATGSWGDAVRLATLRDGVRVPPEVLDARLAAMCDVGTAGACAIVGVRDRTTLGDALAPFCAAGDPVACLGVAWSSLPVIEGRVDPSHPPDPVRYRTLAEGACDAGLRDGCIEVGTVHHLGIDTYPNATHARKIWTAACDDGDARACTQVGALEGETGWLEEGAAGGDPLAWLTLGQRGGTGAHDRLRQACDAGLTAACVDLFVTFGEAEPLHGACALGDPVACALRIRADGEAGVLGRSEAAEALAAWCPEVRSACEEATFLAQGSAPIGRYSGRMNSSKDADKLVAYLQTELDRCNRDALGRDPSLPGRMVHGALRVAADGRVTGAWLENPIDEAHRTCVTDAVLGERILRPVFGEARADLWISTFHGAVVQLDTLDGKPEEDPTEVREDLSRWADPLDRCFLDHDSPDAGVDLDLGFVAAKDGTLRQVEILSTSETPAVDQCVVDWLSNHVLTTPPPFPDRVRARVTFLVRHAHPQGDWTPPPPPVEPPPQVRVRTLVLAVTGSVVERRLVTFGQRAVRSIEATHQALADRVQRETFGAVVLDTTVRTLPVVVDGLGTVEELPDLSRWDLPFQDLPQAVADAIAPGRWDSVFLWVPVPFARERPRIGTTWNSANVGGATVSILALPARTVLRDSLAVPAEELPLHEWWHQIEVRAERLLGVGDLPHNHEPMGHLDPRTWADPPSETVMAWYTEVLGTRHPDLWRDLFGTGEQIATPDADLALRGRPISEGVFSPEGLNDTWIVFGSFPNVPRGDPDADEVWFGVQWRDPLVAARVVAHLGGLADPSEPSFRRPVLEVAPASDPSRWVPVGTARFDGPTATFSFAPSEIVAVRIRVDDDARAPTCRELEVFAAP